MKYVRTLKGFEFETVPDGALVKLIFVATVNKLVVKKVYQSIKLQYIIHQKPIFELKFEVLRTVDFRVS